MTNHPISAKCPWAMLPAKDHPQMKITTNLPLKKNVPQKWLNLRLNKNVAQKNWIPNHDDIYPKNIESNSVVFFLLLTPQKKLEGHHSSSIIFKKKHIKKNVGKLWKFCLFVFILTFLSPPPRLIPKNHDPHPIPPNSQLPQGTQRFRLSSLTCLAQRL